jgi:hypothetical protein
MRLVSGRTTRFRAGAGGPCHCRGKARSTRHESGADCARSGQLSKSRSARGDCGDLFYDVPDLGRRHEDYGVKPEHHEPVGAALLWTLEQGLGPDFTPPVKEAWTGAYLLLAGVMQDAAAAV